MTKPEAVALREEIRAQHIHCTIPRGQTCPRIVTLWGEITFTHRAQWEEYLKLKDSLAELRQYREQASRQRPRSPIDMLIDRACGLEQ